MRGKGDRRSATGTTSPTPARRSLKQGAFLFNERLLIILLPVARFMFADVSC